MNSNEFQPNLDDPSHGEGVSDRAARMSQSALKDIGLPTQPTTGKNLAYGGIGSVKQLAYGGNSAMKAIYATSNRIYKVERGYPRMRRGVLLPSIPRTKAETIYSKDTGQALQNKVLNTGATGTGTSGIPIPGTPNKANSTTGAINRYRTTYKTNLQ